MDIFSSLKDSGKNAVQRTREMAEISRINSTISGLQKEMNKCYCDLGEQMVNRCVKENVQMDNANVKRVIEIRAQIESLQLQQARLRGVVTCPNCHSEVDASAAFCNVCGTEMPRIQVQPPADAAVCPSCGGEMYQRDDDKEETVQNRLKVYEQKTAPLIAFYESKGKLFTVNGDAHIDAVTDEIVKGLDA